VLKRKGLTTLMLHAVSQSDVAELLRAALGVRTVPPELLQLVQDFSGGSFFWVREILQFIKEHGAEQFLSAVGEGQMKENKVEPPPPRGSPTLTPLRRGSSVLKLSQLQRERTEMTSTSRSVSFHSLNSGRSASDPKQSQLDKLLLVRFGGLPLDAQRVLRAASVIGATFTASVLHAVLPSRLRGNLEVDLSLLVSQVWLYKDPENDQVFSFGHPHAQQVIYELTPSSERNHLYAQIASHVERLHGTDPAYFATLSHYYRHCDAGKSLKYVAKAQGALLAAAASIFDFAEAVDLLSSSLALCNDAEDALAVRRLLNTCRRSIEDHGGETPGSPGKKCLWQGIGLRYFASCLLKRTRSSAVAPTTPTGEALSAPEQSARDAYLEHLTRVEEDLDSLLCSFELD
jgi:hypothetical protein